MLYIPRILGAIAIGTIFFGGNIFGTDLLERVIQPSKDYEQIIDLGNSREAVGNEIFREGTSIDVSGAINQGQPLIQQREPLIVRLTQLFLRITIAISITMIIIIGVKLIRSGISGTGLTEGLKDVRNLVIGLVIALSSVAIIYLIQSFTLSSLDGNPVDLEAITAPQ